MEFRVYCTKVKMMQPKTIRKVRKYADMTESTPYAAHELSSRSIGAPDKSSGKRLRSIHICHDLTGFIPLSELVEQEMA